MNNQFFHKIMNPIVSYFELFFKRFDVKGCGVRETSNNRKVNCRKVELKPLIVKPSQF